MPKILLNIRYTKQGKCDPKCSLFSAFYDSCRVFKNSNPNLHNRAYLCLRAEEEFEKLKPK